MAQNPLAIEPVTPKSQAANPLAPMRKRRAGGSAQTPMSPMLAHARIWQHVNSMPSDQLEAISEKTDYLLPVLGKLAGNPKVTGKDVIKAVADAVADGQIEPSQGVSFIQQIPQNPHAIRPWLKMLYAANFTGAIHTKAAQIQQQAAAQQGVQPAAAPQQVAAPAPIAQATQQPVGAPP